MLESYYSSGQTITKAVGHFPGIVIPMKWPAGRDAVGLGRGFSVLSKSHPLAVSYAAEQRIYGYTPKHGAMLLLDYGGEVKNEFYDDPYQKFLRLGLSISIAMPFKVLPQSFTVLNDAGELQFYRPRCYLPADDYNTLSFEKRKVPLRVLRKVLDLYGTVDAIFSKAQNTKINDALTYYSDYLRELDPKIELVLLTMILEVLFIEDESTAELQTKLMARLSRFLKPKPSAKKQRYELSEFVKDIYRIRSEVLHGSEYRKTLERMAKSTKVTPQQYLSSHIAKLDSVVMVVLKRILLTQDELMIMSKYPRNSSDTAIREMYQRLLLG